MSTHASGTAQNPSEEQFFTALMDYIMAGKMIPKVQLERVIGPLLGFFLEAVMSAHHNRKIIMLSPEFPIRKTGSDGKADNQSTNIDWLMYDIQECELVLVELKTTDTSFRREQAKVYQDLQTRINTQKKADFLLEDLRKIFKNSKVHWKYENVIGKLDSTFTDLGKKEDILENCKSARVIYLAPKVSQPKNWTSMYPDWQWIPFEKLPIEIKHDFGFYWKTLRDSLLQLDNPPKKNRDGDSENTVINYSEKHKYKELLKHCQTEGKSMVIGLKNWRKKLPSMKLEQLQTKTYKCDSSSGGVGKKIDRNWISGDEFLSHVSKLGS